MPFINPYNFARLSRVPMPRAEARGWDRVDGQSGELICVLHAETPLFIPSGNATGNRKDFFQVAGTLALPATSLKGAYRSVAEAIGGGCSPFSRNGPDQPLDRCASNKNLCVCCRLFGFLSQTDVMRGRVSFGDAIALNADRSVRPIHLERFGNPKITHGAFYRDGGHLRGRKFYWHHPTVLRAQDIPRQMQIPAPNGVSIHPVNAGARFQFSVRYEGLTPSELSLLLWALQPGGVRRNKIGYGKGIGMGTIHLEVEQWQAAAGPVSLYEHFEPPLPIGSLQEQLASARRVLVEEYAQRLRLTGPVPEDLFALPDDNLSDLDSLLTPRTFAYDVHYPSHIWFQRRSTELLPTTAETVAGQALPD